MKVDHSDTASALESALVRQLALAAGFDDAGLVALPHTHIERDATRFESWIDAGRAGTMGYLERTSDTGKRIRARVDIPFPWVRSAIVCFFVYNSAQPRSIEPADPGAGWIARYAWSSTRDANGKRRPTDYHKVLLKRLRTLETRLHEQYGAFESRAYVDTGPVVERSLASAAGLGWSAKNTCLIHPKLGSWGFLAVLLTALPVAEGKASLPSPDRCGTCRRCIEACPTDALFAPYQMDATRCIAYLTIEHKGPIAPDLMKGTGRQIFGCDICQDVCPWNRKAAITNDKEMESRSELINPALDWLANLTEQEFESAFNGSPVRRAGYLGMQRNFAVAMGNSGLRSFGPRLSAWAGAADEGLRTAAQWALKKLNL